MSTEFSMGDQVVAVRFFGGTARGTRVQMEVTEAEWQRMDRSQTVTSNGWGDQTGDEWMAEMQATATVVWMNRFVMNARANKAQKLAEKWAKDGYHNGAHAAAMQAQQLRAWRED